MSEKKPLGGPPARLPETEPPPPPSPEGGAPPATKTPREWAKEKRTPAWQLAAATAGHVWLSGKTLTESEFDLAITAALAAEAG